MSWQALIEEGHVAFSCNNWSESEDLYRQGLMLIEQMWLHDAEQFSVFMAWVSVLHNLSELYERQRRTDEALRYLLVPHDRMLALSCDVSFSTQFQQQVIKAMNVTLLPILAYSKRHPACEDCIRGLQGELLMSTAAGQTIN